MGAVRPEVRRIGLVDHVLAAHGNERGEMRRLKNVPDAGMAAYGPVDALVERQYGRRAERQGVAHAGVETVEALPARVGPVPARLVVAPGDEIRIGNALDGHGCVLCPFSPPCQKPMPALSDRHKRIGCSQGFKAAPVGDEAGHLAARVEIDPLVEAVTVPGKRTANQCGNAGSRRQATLRLLMSSGPVDAMMGQQGRASRWRATFILT